MEAAVYSTYGSPDVLRIIDRPRPVPGPGQVLVKMQAASINSWDWDLLTGTPLLTRLVGGGVRKPRLPVLGADIAGRIEEVGLGVNIFQVGDAVLGDVSAHGWGGFAEYVAVPAAALSHKPKGLSFAQAAAIPQAGVLALQGLRALGRPLRPGDRVLINGAGGGVGTFALQLAKAAGAVVTVVDRADKLDALRARGADAALDYRTQDFVSAVERSGPQDLVLDMVLRRSISDCLRALAPQGAYVMIGGATRRIFEFAFVGSWLPRVLRNTRRLRILVHKPNVNDVDTLTALCAAGTLSPVIDSVVPLRDIARAMSRIGAGDVEGKLIIAIGPEAQT